MPGSNCRVVEDAKDLKPRSVTLFKYNVYSSRASTWSRSRSA
jgi:hypothetical protein